MLPFSARSYSWELSVPLPSLSKDLKSLFSLALLLSSLRDSVPPWRNW